MAVSQPSQGQAPAAGASTPDAVLAEARKSLQDSQAQIDGLARTRDALSTRIGTLGQSVDEGKKLLAAYTAAYPGLDSDDKDLVTFDQSKMSVIHLKLSADRMALVDSVVSTYDAEVAAKKADADRLAKAAADAHAASDRARADHQAARDDFGSLKALQKGLTDKDAASKKLIAEIGGYEAKKDYEAMYFRLKDALEPAANDFHGSIVSVDAFKGDIDTAVLDLDETWQAAQAKKQAADAADAQAAAAKAAYDAMVAGRTAELLKRIAALPPAPPAPPPPAVLPPPPPSVQAPAPAAAQIPPPPNHA